MSDLSDEEKSKTIERLLQSNADLQKDIGEVMKVKGKLRGRERLKKQLADLQRAAEKLAAQKGKSS